MQNPLKRRRKLLFVWGGFAAVATLSSAALFTWWNTNAFGAEEFCDGMFASNDVRAALNSSGRVAEVSSQTVPEFSEFRCTVKRTSRFIGADDSEVTIRTATEPGAFPFTTAVWKNPSTMSYFKDGASGAVSDTRGWILLPKACWDRVGNIQGSRRIPPNPKKVAAVEATVRQGVVDRRGLARLLAHAAQKVAESAGCSTAGLKAPSDLSILRKPRTTDARNACGIQGFSLPNSSLVKGLAEPGREQLTGETPHTWACDMYLDGASKSQISFSISSDVNVIDGALRDSESFREVAGNKGLVGIDEAVLHCKDGDVYFSVRWNAAYNNVLLDLAKRKSHSYAEMHKSLFQGFLDSAADSRSCPRVTLPFK